jgi:hypothetical protein
MKSTYTIFLGACLIFGMTSSAHATSCLPNGQKMLAPMKCSADDSTFQYRQPDGTIGTISPSIGSFSCADFKKQLDSQCSSGNCVVDAGYLSVDIKAVPHDCQLVQTASVIDGTGFDSSGNNPSIGNKGVSSPNFFNPGSMGGGNSGQGVAGAVNVGGAPTPGLGP